MNEMTHCLSVCNNLSLLLRYNEDEDMVEYKYSDETEVNSVPVTYTDKDELGIFIGGDFYYLSEFCLINI